jgi:bifunctional DNA-binding transcriptional regulator/antitoxin component of YhaV-PrlF toxin-antitoxin module
MPRRSKKQPGLAESQRNWKPEQGPPERLFLALGPGGRVVIPAVYRKAMELEDGGQLMASVVDGELRLITPMMSIRRAQRIVRETIPADADLIADLFEMRRQEVEDELDDG